MNVADVPAGPLLIDTDVFSWLAWRRGRHAEFSSLIEGHVLVLSFATVGELYAGAAKAQWGVKRREALERTLSQYVIAPTSKRITECFGELYARFMGRLKGDCINDLWIAATALALVPPVPVVTGNLADFGAIASEFPLQIIHPDVEV